jgi:arylsulfatase A-like enzyme
LSTEATERQVSVFDGAARFVLAGILSLVLIAVLDGIARIIAADGMIPSVAAAATALGTSMLVGTLIGVVTALLVGFATAPGPAARISGAAIAGLAKAPVHILLLAAIGFLVPVAIAVPVRAKFLAQSSSLAAAIGVIAVLLGWTIALVIHRLLGDRAGPRLPKKKTGWVLAAIAILVPLLGARYRPALDAADLWDLVLYGDAALAILAAALLLPATRRIKTVAITVSVVSLLAGGFALTRLNSSMELRLQVADDWRPTSMVVENLVALVDRDNDGFSPLFGGGDCDDSREDINPDEIEIAGNGVDENCRNGDKLAQSPWPARPKFVELPAGVREPRSILMISVDAMRQDRIGAYGCERPTTPRIDELAAHGVRFANARSTSPNTRLALPVLHTGLYIGQIPWDRSVYPFRMLPRVDTMAEILAREKGLKTAAFVTHQYLGKKWGFAQGFEHIDESLVLPRSEYEKAITGERLANRIIEWIEANRDQRFFIWAHFLDPHEHYLKHKEGPDFGNKPFDRYDSEIWYEDKHVGRIFDKLAELGIVDETMIVLLSDHGEYFGEHGKRNHGGSLYKENSRIPLIIRSPGIKPHVAECVVGHIDLPLTVLNLFGIDGGDYGMSGETLIPDMTGLPCDPDREIGMEIRYGRLNAANHKAIVGNRWKLMLNVKNGTYKLFDLANDPGEKHNLVSDNPVKFEEMKRRLHDWAEVQVNAEHADILKRLTMDELPAKAERLDAAFKNGLELVGMDFGSRSTNYFDLANLQLFLRTPRRLKQECMIIFDIVDDAGETRHTTKHPPVKGLLPLKRWPLGKIVTDSFVYQLARSRIRSKVLEFRAYDIRLSLKCDGKKVPVERGDTDDKGRVKAGQIEMKRAPRVKIPRK